GMPDPERAGLHDRDEIDTMHPAARTPRRRRNTRRSRVRAPRRAILQAQVQPVSGAAPTPGSSHHQRQVRRLQETAAERRSAYVKFLPLCGGAKGEPYLNGPITPLLSRGGVARSV